MRRELYDALVRAYTPALADFYRRRTGEDTNTDAFKQRIHDENRCLIRLRTTRVVQPPPRPQPRPST
jgi:hypothetical protein